MSKATALVLSSGGLHSLVCCGLASREYRIGMLHLKDQRPTAKQAGDAFDRQVAHFKPIRSWLMDAGYFRQMSLPAESAGMVSTTGSDVQAALVPFREIQFLAAAAGFAQQIKAGTILWGVHREPKVADELAKLMEFVQVMNQMLELMSHESPIVVKAPLLGLEDHQIVELGYQMGLPFNLSWTCQMATNETPCMGCQACVRRIRMFRAAQLADPLVVKK